MQEPNKYGILLNDGIKLHRKYFQEMVRLLGIQCVYRAPLKDKTYTLESEVISNYSEPEQVGVIFTDHPDQKTLRKIGWVSEIQADASLIHVPYDLHDLQKGALFYIPSGIDNASFKLFRVESLSNIMVYPASITCEIVPEFEDKLPLSATKDFSITNFNLLRQGD